MRSLFLKIFLWFWITLIGTAAAFATLVLTLEAGARRASDRLAYRVGSRAARLRRDLLRAHAIPDRPRPPTARRGPATGGRRIERAGERLSASPRRDWRVGP